MEASIRKVVSYDITVRDVPGEAYRVLSTLSQEGVSLLAFQAVPIGPDRTRLVLFTDDEPELKSVAQAAGFHLDEPQHAILVQGDAEMGALARIHKQVFDADVNVFASWGVTDGRGGYGYVMYVREERFQAAAEALGI